ncbi:MAG: type I glutamate--ammonia ligase [Brevinematales bacterium]|nr:type I glutamate--ammonia ligase [Brevinematales bacterium]
MFKDKNEALKFIKDQGIEIIDLRFMDFPGLWQHFSIPASEIDEDVFDKGLGFDGSSIRGWQSINESDMLLTPDPTSAFVDPFAEHKTLIFFCDIKDPLTGKDYTRDPRHIAKKAETYLKSTGIGDTAYFGSELEFFVFDKAYFDQNSHSGYYFIDSDEAIWNSGNERNIDGSFNRGYKIRHKEGYFPVPPHDSLQDLRNEAVIILQKIGIRVETHHHEVATAGQGEIDFRFDTLTKTADNVLKVKYVLKNVAWKRGKTVTFMPKPIFGDNGTGMHTHQSIWKDGKNLFAGDKYAGLSQEALWYIGGLLKHAKAVAAFTNPSTNSYKRLVPGFEAPINLAYSARNRSAAVRIPVYSTSPKAKRIEYRPPDATSNPYLAFAAMLMAGLDGIRNRIDPGEPIDKNIYDLPPEEKAKIPQYSGSLEESLNALANDHEFLLQGDVFTKDVIETWIEYKMNAEVKAIAQRPHPYEFVLYFDV